MKRLVATSKQEEKRKTYTQYASAIGILITLAMTTMNIIGRSYVMMVTTGLLFLGYLAAFFLIRKDRISFKLMRVCVAAMTSLVFTWYVITGGQEGFSAIWLTLVPPVFFLCFGFAIGYACCGYFLLLLAFSFWTPYRAHFVNIYPSVFMNRFPIVFIAVFALAHIISRQLFLYEAKQEDHENELNEAVNQERERVEQFSVDMAMTIVSAVDAKDQYTHQHSKRVALYSAEICRKLGSTPEECTRAFYIALMHDVGKIGVPDSILTKKAKLTDEEYECIKKHTGVGAQILANIKTFDGISDGALYHHERYDGTGYHGIKGENIPLIGRIIAVADSIDAMHSKRVYSEARPLSVVAEEIRRCSGSQFDPGIADVALQLIDEGVFDGSDTVIDYRINQYLSNNSLKTVTG